MTVTACASFKLKLVAAGSCRTCEVMFYVEAVNSAVNSNYRTSSYLRAFRSKRESGDICCVSTTPRQVLRCGEKVEPAGYYFTNLYIKIIS